MRFVFFIFFLTISLIAKSGGVDYKIKNTSTKLNMFNKTYSNISKKMSKNARAILKQKQQITKQQTYLKNLKKELKEKELSYKANTLQLKELKKNQQKLYHTQTKLEKKLISEISQSVSLSVILKEQQTTDANSLIEFEVLKQMLKKSKSKANRLNQEYYTNSKDIDTLNIQASSLEVAISNIDKKRKDLLEAQKRNKKSLEKLKLAKSSYKKELKNILRKQDSLKKTLARLNIIKIDERKKAIEEEQRRKAFALKTSNKNLPKVKRHGSSYQVVKTRRYYGDKTIAPLRSYTITKRYGTYTDPIYGIKVFNESISLKPTKKGAKVKNVFNGKVIYADKTPVLNNIVIVEHKNGIHTIYANLSKISPNIRKGKKIKKGYTIGRIDDELLFEVTQKSYHINPIRLFK